MKTTLRCRLFGHKTTVTVSQLSMLAICQRPGCMHAKALDISQEQRDAISALVGTGQGNGPKAPAWRPKH